MIDWPSYAMSTAVVVAWIVIGTGLLQTAFYVVQLVFAGLSLTQRPPVSNAALLWQRYRRPRPADRAARPGLQ